MKVTIIQVLTALLFFATLQSQSYSIKELNKITSDYYKEGKYQEIIEYNRKALKSFLASDNKEGIFLANINIANYLAAQSNYQESINNLKKIDKYVGFINNPELLSKYYGGYGNNFSHLGMYKLSNSYFDKAIKAAKNIKDKGISKERQYIGYLWKLSNFKDMHLIDSVKVMERKCLSIRTGPFLYSMISRRFLEDEKNLDSAQFYLEKASHIVKKFPLFNQAVILESYGALYFEKKDYHLAIDYYLKALELYKKFNNRKGLREVYKFLYINYEAINEVETANSYLKNYIILNDSITQQEKAIVNIPIEKILHENDQSRKFLKREFKIIIITLMLFFIIIVIFLIKAYRNKKKIISKTLAEKQILERKLDVAITEIIELAKKRSPLFLSRFKDAYPDFYSNLTTQYPSLTTKEIKLCALLKLNFSTKEIADYEHVAIRTIEARRYKIRQKLKLCSTENLNIWLNKF